MNIQKGDYYERAYICSENLAWQLFFTSKPFTDLLARMEANPDIITTGPELQEIAIRECRKKSISDMGDFFCRSDGNVEMKA